MTVPAGFKALPLPIAQLSLAAVLKCGQSFRWIAYPLHESRPETDAKTESEDEKVDVKATVPSHEYRFALKDRVVCLRQDEASLFYRSVFPASKEIAKNASKSKPREKSEVKVEDEAIGVPVDRDEETVTWLKDYFQLDVDLVKLYGEWAAKDAVFRDTVKERFAGIRMLRQDPWENVVS